MMGGRFLPSRSFGLLYPLGLLAVGSVTAQWWPPFVSIGLVFLAGLVLFLHLSGCFCTDPKLMWIVCGSYLLRAAVAVFFFVVSAYRLPVSPTLQLGDGFWQFVPDAQGYHARALSLLGDGLQNGWIQGSSGVDVFGGLVAWVYWWFTSYPLVAILFNVWVAAGTTLLAFEIGRHTGGSTGHGLAAAVFVGFWPSTFIWSAQLLKDPLFLFLLFLVFSLVLRLLSPGKPARLSDVFMLGTIYMAVFLLAKLRPYSGWVLLGSVGVAGVLSLAFLQTQRRAVSLAGLALIALGVLMGVSRPFWLPLPSVLLSKTLEATASRQAPSSEAAPSQTTASRQAPSGEAAPSQTTASRQAPSGEAAPSQFPSLPRPPTVSLPALESVRDGYVQSGGNILDPDVDISIPSGFLRQLPAAIVAAIFTPHPWRWFLRGDTGVFRRFAAVEVILLVLLVPGLSAGSVAVVRMRSIVGCFMLVYGVLIWFLVALVVANEGSMFRLRLQGVLPVVVVAIAGGGLRVYSRFLERLCSLLTCLR